MGTYLERKQKLRETFKPREEWWSRVFATPLAHGILHVVADVKVLTPNRLTTLSFSLTLLTSLLIVSGMSSALLSAAILLQIAYVFDCMDGQLARYREVSSEWGSFLDKWSDYVKFATVVLALMVEAYSQNASFTVIVMGFLSVFFIGYLPYLKGLSLQELSIGPWAVLSGKNFAERNLRFFLFEEAQLYLIVTICLLFQSSYWALVIICATQGIVAFVQTARVFLLSRHSR
jgi:phosphatidylglycerophosphate synthase